MKRPLLIVLCLLLSIGAFAGTSFDPKDPFPAAPLDGMIASYNSKVISYNDLAESLVQFPKDRDNIERTRGELKASMETLKKQIEELQSLLDSAKASRGQFPDAAQIPWGSTAKQVAELMTKRGAKLTEQSASQSEFSGGEFAGEEARRWAFRFVNDRLYEVQVYFASTAQSMELFRHWHEALATKYGITDVAQQLYFRGFGVQSSSFRDTEPSTAGKRASAANAMITNSWQPTVRWSFAGGSRIDLVAASTDMVAIVYVNGAIKTANSGAPKTSSAKDL